MQGNSLATLIKMPDRPMLSRHKCAKLSSRAAFVHELASRESFELLNMRRYADA